jgi:hypothetical protein
MALKRSKLRIGSGRDHDIQQLYYLRHMIPPGQRGKTTDSATALQSDFHSPFQAVRAIIINKGVFSVTPFSYISRERKVHAAEFIAARAFLQT